MTDKFNHKIKSIVEKYGVRHSLELFEGNVDVIQRAYGNNSSEFLHRFNDLTDVRFQDMIIYVNKERIPLFYYQPEVKNGDVYIEHKLIWVFFSDIIKLKYGETQDIIKNWLDETYNIKGFTPEPCNIIIPFSILNI